MAAVVAAAASTMQDHWPYLPSPPAPPGDRCQGMPAAPHPPGAEHTASLAICLSTEATEIPFNVNVSSKAPHFLSHTHTFSDFRDLLFMFPDTKSFLIPFLSFLIQL